MDPRIHFALVRGLGSSAAIRFYEAEYIDQQLETAVQNFANSAQVVILPKENRAVLSHIFKWYAWDFGGKRGALQFLLPYITDADKKLFLKQNLRKVQIEYLQHD